MTAAEKRLHRRQRLRWLIEAGTRYPLGVVPIALAAKVLGCSAARIRAMVAKGRITAVCGLPGLEDRVFVPVVDLITAPEPRERGKKGIFGRARARFSTKIEPVKYRISDA